MGCLLLSKTEKRKKPTIFKQSRVFSIIPASPVITGVDCEREMTQNISTENKQQTV